MHLQTDFHPDLLQTVKQVTIPKPIRSQVRHHSHTFGPKPQNDSSSLFMKKIEINNTATRIRLSGEGNSNPIKYIMESRQQPATYSKTDQGSTQLNAFEAPADVLKLDASRNKLKIPFYEQPKLKSAQQLETNSSSLKFKEVSKEASDLRIIKLQKDHQQQTNLFNQKSQITEQKLVSNLKITNQNLLSQKYSNEIKDTQKLIVNQEPQSALHIELNSKAVTEVKGDQLETLNEEQPPSLVFLQSSMIESCKMRERNAGSLFHHPKTPKLTKRLLDLLEPRTIEEEENENEEEIYNFSRQHQQYQNSTSKKQPERVLNKEKEELFQQENDQDLFQNIEEFSCNQIPPSMAQINNQQMNRDWSNSKQAKQNECKFGIKDFNQKLATTQALTLEQDEQEWFISTNTDNYKIQRRKSSAGSLNDIIPDEPEKIQTASKFQFKSLNKIEMNEYYFVHPLIKSFRGDQGKLSQLFQEYFHKIFNNLKSSNLFTHNLSDLQSVILPPQHPNRKTIFFDLDETLIHCIDIFTSQQQFQDFTLSNMTTQMPYAYNTESCNEVLCSIQYSPSEQIKCIFSIRPFAQEILEELSKDFELILFTAARKMYADAVLDKLDPQKKYFSHRFYRDSCIQFDIYKQNHSGVSKSYLKDLRIFKNRSIENIVLVDNSPLSFLKQLSNGVPVLDYFNDNKNDQELLSLCQYLKTLLHVNDVRTSINSKFKLNQYKRFNTISILQNYLEREYSIS